MKIEKIIEDYGQSIYRISCCYTDSTEEQEDLVQEILIAVWNEKKISLEQFFLNQNKMSAREAVEGMLGRAINLPDPCDLLEPEK